MRTCCGGGDTDDPASSWKSHRLCLPGWREDTLYSGPLNHCSSGATISQLNYLSAWPLPQASAHALDEQCASQGEDPTQAPRVSFFESGRIMAYSRNREETRHQDLRLRGFFQGHATGKTKLNQIRPSLTNSLISRFGTGPWHTTGV